MSFYKFSLRCFRNHLKNRKGIHFKEWLAIILSSWQNPLFPLRLWFPWHFHHSLIHSFVSSLYVDRHLQINFPFFPSPVNFVLFHLYHQFRVELFPLQFTKQTFTLTTPCEHLLCLNAVVLISLIIGVWSNARTDATFLSQKVTVALYSFYFWNVNLRDAYWCISSNSSAEVIECLPIICFQTFSERMTTDFFFLPNIEIHSLA